MLFRSEHEKAQLNHKPSYAGQVHPDHAPVSYTHLSRFGYANQIRRDRPLTHEELMHYVPGIFGEDKHTSRSQNYTYIQMCIRDRAFHCVMR